MVAQALMTTDYKDHPRISHLLRNITMMALLFISFATHAATLVATVDRNIVSEQESLELTIRADEHSFLSGPDFSPIEKDFHIAGSNQSSSLQIINSNMISITQWKLTLIPKRTGKLRIPAISFGKLESKPINIEVKNSTQKTFTNKKKQAIFLEASIDNGSLYVQAQLLYTVKLFHQTNNITDWSITEPSLNNAIIQELGKAKQYSKFVDGVQYSVLERNYAIFPQSSGYFEIPAIAFAGVVSDQNTRQRFGFSRGRKVSRSSEKIQITVKPIPKKYPNQTWLPAKNLSVKETWSPQHKHFKVGEPSTRTITATVDGLPSSMLPSFELPKLEKLKTYPDKPRLEDDYSGHSTLSQRIESNAIIPTHKGNLDLPEVAIYWWNTNTDTLERSVIKKQRINIEPGEAQQQTSAGASNAPINGDIALANQQLTLEFETLKSSLMIWKAATAILLLAVLLLIASIIYLARQKTQPAQTNPEVDTDPTAPSTALLIAPKKAQQQLLLHTQANDPEAIKGALIPWAKSCFNDPSINSLGEIKERTGHTPLIKAITRLEKKIYSSSAVTNWSGEEIAAAINNLSFKDLSTGSINDKLPGLYPT